MPRKPAAEANAPAATVHDLTLVRGQGGELHQVADRDTDVLTTAQGGPVSDDQNTLKIGARGPTLIEDFISARRFSISTMNAFPRGSCRRVVMALMAFSKPTSRSQNIRAPTSSSELEKKRRHSRGSRRWPAARGHSTLPATSADLP